MYTFEAIPLSNNAASKDGSCLQRLLLKHHQPPD